MGYGAADLKRRKTFWKLERLCRNQSLPIETKIKLLETTCVTILLYDCESWVVTSDMEDKIRYSVMLNIKRVDFK